MNWAALSKPFLDLGMTALGTLLGGPAGAVVGKAIADQIGVPATPEAVGSAMADPEVQKRLAETEAEWARTQAAIAQSNAQQGSSINATMQAEIASGVSWYHFRHLNGYVVFLLGISMVAAFNGSLFFGKPAIGDFKTALDAIWAPFAAFCGLVGYVAMDTSRRTQAAATGTPITGVLDIIGGLFKRK